MKMLEGDTVQAAARLPTTWRVYWSQASTKTLPSLVRQETHTDKEPHHGRPRKHRKEQDNSQLSDLGYNTQTYQHPEQRSSS